MKPVEFPAVNLRIAENQEEYQTLPVYVKKGPAVEMIVKIEVSDEEADKIKRTGTIWASILTFGKSVLPFYLTADELEVFTDTALPNGVTPR